MTLNHIQDVFMHYIWHWSNDDSNFLGKFFVQTLIYIMMPPSSRMWVQHSWFTPQTMQFSYAFIKCPVCRNFNIPHIGKIWRFNQFNWLTAWLHLYWVIDWLKFSSLFSIYWMCMILQHLSPKKSVVVLKNWKSLIYWLIYCIYFVL